MTTAQAAVLERKTMTDKTENEEAPRSFTWLLANIGEGTLNAELSETLKEMNGKLAARAEDFGKAKGTLTLTLSIEMDREGVVTLTPDVKTKCPPPARALGRYWLTPGNNLSPENPKQTKLNLKEVPARGTRSV